MELLLEEKVADPCVELAGVKGLGKEVIHVGLEGADAGSISSVGRDQENGNTGGSLIFTKASGGLDTVHPRHHVIEDDEIGLVLESEADALFSGG